MNPLRVLMLGVSAVIALAGAALAQEPPQKFDLSCDARSSDPDRPIRANLRFAIDLETASMRAYHDGKLQDATPIKVGADELVLRDEDQAPLEGYAKTHVRETVDRRTGAFVSDMSFIRVDGSTDETKVEGQCLVARYTGADGKPLY